VTRKAGEHPIENERFGAPLCELTARLVEAEVVGVDPSQKMLAEARRKP
jgi:hypothetical protein